MNDVLINRWEYSLGTLRRCLFSCLWKRLGVSRVERVNIVILLIVVNGVLSVVSVHDVYSGVQCGLFFGLSLLIWVVSLLMTWAFILKAYILFLHHRNGRCLACRDDRCSRCSNENNTSCWNNIDWRKVEARRIDLLWNLNLFVVKVLDTHGVVRLD